MVEIAPAFGVAIDGPHFSDEKWVSPLYWGEDVQGMVTPPQRVLIHDVTLRDGEQAPRVVFTPDEKVLIARELDKLGVHSIEPGFAIGPEDREVLQALTTAGLRAKIIPLARVREGDVRGAIDAKAHGMVLEMGLNPFILRDVFQTTPDRLIDEVTEYAQAARRAGLYVEFMAWDVMRIPSLDFIERFFAKLAERAPLDRITIADTFGMGHPLATFHLIRRLKALTGMPFGFHIHNDYGLATAASVMAVSAGADMVHTSVNGIGERAGNVATEEVAMALQHMMDIDCGIDLSRIASVSEVVAHLSRVPVARNKPIVGGGLFEVESGIVVGLIEDLKKTPFGGDVFFPFKPHVVGRPPYQVVAGRGVGRRSVLLLLGERGIDADEPTVARIVERIKEMGLIFKDAVPDRFVEQIIAEETEQPVDARAAATG